MQLAQGTSPDSQATGARQHRAAKEGSASEHCGAEASRNSEWQRRRRQRRSMKSGHGKRGAQSADCNLETVLAPPHLRVRAIAMARSHVRPPMAVLGGPAKVVGTANINRLKKDFHPPVRQGHPRPPPSPGARGKGERRARLGSPDECRVCRPPSSLQPAVRPPNFGGDAVRLLESRLHSQRTIFNYNFIP